MLPLRHIFRLLTKDPSFTVAVCLTLAIGVGASTAIFSFANGILLRPLPFSDPDRIALIKFTRDAGGKVRSGTGLYDADFLELKRANQCFADAATYTLAGDVVTVGGSPDAVGCAVVTHNFFTVLGSNAAVGRVFTPEDQRQRAGRLAVLTYAYWQTKFGGNASAVGQTFSINGVGATVIGVLPPDFPFLDRAQLFVSAASDVPEWRVGYPGANFKGRGAQVVTVIGRLKPGITLLRAQEELAEIVRGLPNPNQSSRPVYLETMREHIVGDIRPVLFMLLGCVGLVLLIVCLNVANLLLARAMSRRREMSVRLALGASPGRVARQGLGESLVFGLVGGAFGILAGSLGTHLLLVAAPSDVPRLAAVRVDPTVLAFSLLLSLLASALSGLVPAWEMGSGDPGRVLGESSRGATSGASRRRLRDVLVGVEVAFSLVLLVVGGLLFRSFQRLEATSWGFDPSHVVTMRLSLIDARFASANIVQIQHNLLDKLAGEPGFESVGLCNDRIGSPFTPGPIAPEGQVFASTNDMPVAYYHVVSPGYFKTLGIPLLQGRAFTRQDSAGGQLVAIIDAAVARQYFPDGQAVGKRVFAVWNTPTPSTPYLIIGVAGNVKTFGPEAVPAADLYITLDQRTDPSVYISVRTRLAPAVCVATVKRVLAQVDPTVPLANVATMDEVVARPGLSRRFTLVLVEAFAAISLVLAAIGIYAVISHSVVQRTREIGIRVALGARPIEVILMTMRQGGLPVAAGIGAGIVVSALAGFALERLLFGVPPFDPPTYLAVSALLAGIAALACGLPALRASRVDPVVALRLE